MWEKWNSIVHIDHGSRPKAIGLGRSILQIIAKTQENVGEMLKTQKRQNEVNHHILQDSIGLQKEVKILLGAIRKGKESGSMMGHSSKQSIKKCSRHEDSKESWAGKDKAASEMLEMRRTSLLPELPNNGTSRG